MRGRRSILMRRRRRRINAGFELQLTSMMDVLVIIVVFLLKSYATSTSSLATVPGLKLPSSGSPDSAFDTLQVIVTPEAVTVDSQRVLDFVQSGAQMTSGGADYAFRSQDLDEGGRRIVPLYDALVRAKEKTELMRARLGIKLSDGQTPQYEGILSIQADKAVQYDTLRKIMYTAAAAGFKTFRFIALRRDT